MLENPEQKNHRKPNFLESFCRTDLDCRRENVGLFPKKGTIAVDSDADIVIFDAEQEHTFGVANEHMNVDYSSYEDWTVKGKVEIVLSRGRVVIENGEHKGKARDGQFLKRGTCVDV